MPRTDILERKEDIINWINQGQSKAFICRELQCKQSTLNSYLDKMGIKYEGRQNWLKGKNNENSYISALEYSQRPSCKPLILKEKMFKENIREKKCEICGNDSWMGKPIPLEIHHKDCNRFNNNFDNLQILCPNCHAQQPGNSGANTGNYNLGE